MCDVEVLEKELIYFDLNSEETLKNKNKDKS